MDSLGETMRALVYDTDTGAIQRHLNGAVPLEHQRLADGEGLLVDQDVSVTEDAPDPVHTGIEIPEDLSGKTVDVATHTIVDDPDYSAPSHPSVTRDRVSSHSLDSLKDARSRDATQEQLDILIEIVVGQDPSEW